MQRGRPSLSHTVLKRCAHDRQNCCDWRGAEVVDLSLRKPGWRSGAGQARVSSGRVCHTVRTFFSATVIATLLCLPCTPAWAAGLFLYENGSPDQAMASAGRAALAQDASTALNNPAGMTRLTGPQLVLSAQPLIIDPSATLSAAGTTSALHPEREAKMLSPFRNIEEVSNENSMSIDSNSAGGLPVGSEAPPVG